MFLDKEITPELQKELYEQHFVLARNLDEAIAGALEICPDKDKPDFFLPTGIASRLNELLCRRKYGDLSPFMLKGWSVLKDMRVLDLASGSGASKNRVGTVWYPHFARFCAINGAKVVAVDINPQQGLDRELFAWAQADLFEAVMNNRLASLPILRGREFDLIHSCAFAGVAPACELEDQCKLAEVTIREFETSMLRQVGVLLAENGTMTIGGLDDEGCALLYIKDGDRIIPRSSLSQHRQEY